MEPNSRKTPIKLKSLKEEREMLRSSSNRPRLQITPIPEILNSSSQISLKYHNRTPVMQRLRCLDSPKCIIELNEETNLDLIQKANAAIEVLEQGKEIKKHSGLLYRKEKHVLRSGGKITGINEVGKARFELELFEEHKERKLTRAEADKLINRLQGNLGQFKKN